MTLREQWMESLSLIELYALREDLNYQLNEWISRFSWNIFAQDNIKEIKEKIIKIEEVIKTKEE